MTFTLPYPPTVNTYWRHPVIRGSVRHIISRRGRLYRHAVKTALTAQDVGAPMLDGPLAARLDIYPPDHRRRDRDNLEKAINDSLERAGMFLNDSQIEHGEQTMWPPAKPGRVVVTIWAWDADAQERYWGYCDE